MGTGAADAGAPGTLATAPAEAPEPAEAAFPASPASTARLHVTSDWSRSELDCGEAVGFEFPAAHGGSAVSSMVSLAGDGARVSMSICADCKLMECRDEEDVSVEEKQETRGKKEEGRCGRSTEGRPACGQGRWRDGGTVVSSRSGAQRRKRGCTGCVGGRRGTRFRRSIKLN